jgi:hypothetical protein
MAANASELPKVKDQILSADWKDVASVWSVDDGQATCRYPVIDYLEIRDCSGGSISEPQLEQKALCSLRSHTKSAASVAAINRSNLRPLEREMVKLKTELASLNQERLSGLRNQAAGNLRRAQAPHEAEQAVRFGAVTDEALMLNVSTKGASADAFNALYEQLSSAQPVPEWVCTPCLAGLPEKDLLGMCPGGKPHVDLPPLQKGAASKMELQELLERAVVAEFIDKKAVAALFAGIAAKDKAREEAEAAAAASPDSKKAAETAMMMAEAANAALKECRLSFEFRVQASKCTCTLCTIVDKLRTIQNAIKELSGKVEELRGAVRYHDAIRREARRLARRFRSADEADEAPVNDPVFGEDDDFSGEGVVARQQAQQEWARLADTLAVSDFPLRIAFLDKSGSMGGDSVTFDALQLAYHNCLYPTSGSTLTFLFAGPGETEIVLRRPGDQEVQCTIELGSATWFNEPIARTLQFLAPVVENLDCQAWMQQWRQPPLQVLCMTDGQDNMSPSRISSLSGLLRELKDIRGPTTQRRLYQPISGPLDVSDIGAKVPVWMAWIACGMGGQMMLNSNSNVPREITLVDAIASPCHRDQEALANAAVGRGRAGSLGKLSQQQQDDKAAVDKSTSASRARQRVRTLSVAGDVDVTEALASAPSWSVGHRVRVKASAPGRATKPALVLRVRDLEDGCKEYDLLCDDESKITVDQSLLLGAPATAETMLRRSQKASRTQGLQTGLLSRTAEPDMQRLQVMAVVDTATRDLAVMMQNKNPRSNRISLEEATSAVVGSEEVDETAAAAITGRLIQAQQSVQVTAVSEIPPVEPSEVVLEVLMTAGVSTARLLPEDRVLAQRFISVGLELLVAGGAVTTMHAVDQLGPFAGLAEAYSKRRMKAEGADLDAWHALLAQPLRDILDTMLAKGLLESTTVDGIESRSASEGVRQCMLAAWRFFDPSLTRSGMEDGLRRAVNRFQRQRPAFSFATPAKKALSSVAMDAFASEATAAQCRTTSCSASSDNSRPGTPGQGGSSPSTRGTLKLPDLPSPPRSPGMMSAGSTRASSNSTLANRQALVGRRSTSLARSGTSMLQPDRRSALGSPHHAAGAVGALVGLGCQGLAGTPPQTPPRRRSTSLAGTLR